MKTPSWQKAETLIGALALIAIFLLALAVIAGVLGFALGLRGGLWASSLLIMLVASGACYLLARVIPVHLPQEEIARREAERRAPQIASMVAEYQQASSWNHLGYKSLEDPRDIQAKIRNPMKKWPDEEAFRLALASSPATDDRELRALIEDPSEAVSNAALKTLEDSDVIQRRDARLNERQAELQRAERAAEQKSEQARRAAYEMAQKAKWAAEEELSRQREAALESRHQTALWRAKSTDTPKEVLREMATESPHADVRRAAIETLALLNQAGL